MVNEYGSVGTYDSATGSISYTSTSSSSPSSSSSSSPVGSSEWWASEIASREAAARASTVESPATSVSESGGDISTPTTSTRYTDPRTSQTFATQAIAESLGYGPTLTAGERTDTYAKELEAAGQTGGYHAQLAYMARHDDPLATPLGISGGGGTSGQDVSAQYLNRPDIYRVTDTKQLALMTTGLAAGQAAEQLYQSSKTKSEQRYYETLLRQAETTATGKSAAYHTFAKETGLPQAPNPYEYTADLYVYLEKGYPTSEKERFSPVDYTVLGLSGGKGLNAYVWGDQKHDFTTALDVIAKAEKTGEMGPYGKLGAYSSGYGVLPLSLQQAIGVTVATSPYKETPDKISFDFWGQTPEQMGRGKYVAIGDAGLTKVATGQKVSASGPVVTYTGLPTPFVSGKIEKPTGEVTISAFETLGQAIKATPVLGGFYALGESVSKRDVEAVSKFATTTPILSNVAFGGTVYAAKREYDYQGEKLEKSGYSSQLKDYEKSQKSYQTNVTAFEPTVAQFQKDVAEYEKTKDTIPYEQAQAKYTSLVKRESEINKKVEKLQSEYETVRAKESALSSKLSPFESAGARYKELSGKLVGTGKNEEVAVYGVAKPLLDIGEAYRTSVVAPFESFLKPLDTNPVTGGLKSASLGFVGVPGGLVETAGQALIGGERTLQNLQNFPALAVSGGAIAAEGFVSDPVRFTAGLAGTYALFSLGGTAATKATGYVRTAGKEYIPIEKIGIEPEQGFPLAPEGMTATQLKTSFKTSTLSPTPTKMSTGVGVPPIPKRAVLPGEVPGKTYMWSGWTTSPKIEALKQGSMGEYTLGKGTSELPGMYGAPVLETYFTKVGSQTPANIGFEIFKFPTGVRTMLSSVEKIPSSLSASRDYAAIDVYAQKNVAPGKAYMPMTKAEYEAVLQQGNVMGIMGSKYYTKVGGFGKSHFLGTRIPIVEQVATGKLVPRTTTPKATINGKSGIYDSITPDPYVGAYSLAGSIGISTGSGLYSGTRAPATRTSASRPYQTPDQYLASTRASSTRSSAASSKTKSSSSTKAPSSVPASRLSVSYNKSYAPGKYETIASSSESPRISESTSPTKYTPPPTRPTPITPILPMLPTTPEPTMSHSGTRLGKKRFAEKFSVGEGVGYISLSGKQKPAPKPTRQPATTMRSMAPPTRPVGKTPSVRTNVPTIKKKGRKR